jgi:hypothetical protein
MTTAPDRLTFVRVAARILRILMVVSAVGTCVTWAIGGWKVGAGFALGAVISSLNFYWLHKLVDNLGGSLGGNARPRYRTILLGFRYLILGGAAYVILRVSPISMTAVLTGLFVSTAAVFVEVIFEIVYARK